ncbi:hypothetical protein AMATHDRAFT_6843 [Amanita thiersii Skay4041]|uniref:Uncharacterized protein n=1 Tax=Amanita thiersii Skay4041 TaxID=703135 RepID=A0A2A9NHV9_9AGAR|nr:hypothetical protein AMATHDRAFT_6843 [Amanita thiersii Skay4041]
MNKDNSMKIMQEIHKISEKDKLTTAKQRLIKLAETTKSPSYAQKALPLSSNKSNAKDPRKDGAGGWKTVGDNETTLPNPKQTDEELTATLNNIISENVEWLLVLGSNHIKSANWSKDPKAIVVTMTCNIDKNREDNLLDGKEAFNTLQEVMLDLFLDMTLANPSPWTMASYTTTSENTQISKMSDSP